MWHGLREEYIIIIIIIIIILDGRSGDGGCGSDHDYFCTLQNCVLCKIG
jgi:hypothetical protein